MILQYPPAAFHRVVFAMIGGIVRQADGQLIVLHKRHDALHELRAPPMILGAMIEIDHQRGAVREPSTHASHHCASRSTRQSLVTFEVTP